MVRVRNKENNREGTLRWDHDIKYLHDEIGHISVLFDGNKNARTLPGWEFEIIEMKVSWPTYYLWTNQTVLTEVN